MIHNKFVSYCIRFVLPIERTIAMNLSQMQYYKQQYGYSYDRLAYCSISAIDSTTRYKVLDEVMRLPEVEAVSTSYSLPFWSMSGNNIALPESEKELFILQTSIG